MEHLMEQRQRSLNCETQDGDYTPQSGSLMKSYELDQTQITANRDIIQNLLNNPMNTIPSERSAVVDTLRDTMASFAASFDLEPT